MIKEELVMLHRLFESLNSYPDQKEMKFKFKYALSRNMEAIKTEINLIAEREKPVNDTLASFNKKRDELIMQFGKDKGNGRFEIHPADGSAWINYISELKKLEDKEEFREPFALYADKMKEHSEFLKEEAETKPEDLFRFNIDSMPDFLDTNQITFLRKIGLLE